MGCLFGESSLRLFSSGESGVTVWVKSSVATVMTNVFHKNGIIVSRKLAKIVRIF